MPTIPRPSVGRTVHYILPFGPNQGEVRPATIVRVWNDDIVNLAVFIDGSNDYPARKYDDPPVVWETSVMFDGSQDPQARTWHWPPYVPPREVA